MLILLNINSMYLRLILNDVYNQCIPEISLQMVLIYA